MSGKLQLPETPGFILTVNLHPQGGSADTLVTLKAVGWKKFPQTPQDAGPTVAKMHTALCALGMPPKAVAKVIHEAIHDCLARAELTPPTNIVRFPQPPADPAAN